MIHERLKTLTDEQKNLLIIDYLYYLSSGKNDNIYLENDEYQNTVYAKNTEEYNLVKFLKTDPKPKLKENEYYLIKHIDSKETINHGVLDDESLNDIDLLNYIIYDFELNYNHFDLINFHETSNKNGKERVVLEVIDIIKMGG